MIIYLGSEPKGWLAAEVLRFSIEKHVKEPVEFKEIRNLHLETPLKAKPGSPFYRWFVPHFESYQGKVLYLDSSVVVLGDISDLMTLDMKGKGALAQAITRPSDTGGFYSAALLFDCEKLGSWNPETWAIKLAQDKSLYEKTMWALPGGLTHDEVGSFPESLIKRDEPGEKMIHFADPLKKPWQNPEHPHRELFLSLLKEAVEAQKIPLEPILLEIQMGNIYPKILEDMMQA
ncbi:MAG: hypothetical protein KDK62_01360 [Chlamydiia bacterium]|nr:hypothetical protein [Chlamydiia bacterium]